VTPINVHVILTDTRSFRTHPDKSPSDDGASTTRPTLLGDTQRAWLHDTLAAISGTPNSLLILGSAVQVLSRGRQFVYMEAWDEYRHELDELQDALQKLNVTYEPLIISGDVHFAEARDFGCLLEVTSSGLTHAWWEPGLNSGQGSDYLHEHLVGVLLSLFGAYSFDALFTFQDTGALSAERNFGEIFVRPGAPSVPVVGLITTSGSFVEREIQLRDPAGFCRGGHAGGKGRRSEEECAAYVQCTWIVDRDDDDDSGATGGGTCAPAQDLPVRVCTDNSAPSSFVSYMRFVLGMVYFLRFVLYIFLAIVYAYGTIYPDYVKRQLRSYGDQVLMAQRSLRDKGMGRSTTFSSCAALLRASVTLFTSRRDYVLAACYAHCASALIHFAISDLVRKVVYLWIYTIATSKAGGRRNPVREFTHIFVPLQAAYMIAWSLRDVYGASLGLALSEENVTTTAASIMPPVSSKCRVTAARVKAGQDSLRKAGQPLDDEEDEDEVKSTWSSSTRGTKIGSLVLNLY